MTHQTDPTKPPTHTTGTEHYRRAEQLIATADAWHDTAAERRSRAETDYEQAGEHELEAADADRRAARYTQLAALHAQLALAAPEPTVASNAEMDRLAAHVAQQLQPYVDAAIGTLADLIRPQSSRGPGLTTAAALLLNTAASNARDAQTLGEAERWKAFSALIRRELS